MSPETPRAGVIPYPHAEELVNHWWWRPGWTPGTHWYAWHCTLEDQSNLHRLAASYQSALRDVESLDLIPEQWLHITLQGLGDTDSIALKDREHVHSAVSARLADVPAPAVTFHRPVLHREAVVLPPTDRQPLRMLRDAIRAGIADVWGADGVPESPKFRPHVSVAYVNRDESPSRVIGRLDRVQTEPSRVILNSVSLIDLRREDSCYKWTTIASVELK